MMRAVLPLTRWRWLVWAPCWLLAARAQVSGSYEALVHRSRESFERVKPLGPPGTEPPYRALPSEPPEDTIEALHPTGGVYERTSLQDRPGLDPYHPDLSKVTLLKHTVVKNNELKTTFKWFGKSTRCTANAAEPTTTAGAAGGAGAGDATAGAADAGNGTSTSRKQLKVTHASYSGPHTGPPEDHFVDDA